MRPLVCTCGRTLGKERLPSIWLNCIPAALMRLKGQSACCGSSKNAGATHNPPWLLRIGDVSMLSGLKDSLAKGRHSLSKRLSKKKGVSPSKDALKHTVHVSFGWKPGLAGLLIACWLAGWLAGWTGGPRPPRVGSSTRCT